MSASSIPGGQQRPASTQGDFNVLSFVIAQALGRMQTATLVKVVGVQNVDTLSPVGMVDVEPLVNQLDATGKPTPHATIYNVPYMRMQGGSNAIILDPKVGDIGMAAFASRDISKVKAARKRANPGSFRQYSFSDGMYIGGMLNGTPTQYIQFGATGIKIYSPARVTIEAPDAQINVATAEIVASTSATVTAPVINLGAAGQTLRAFVTSAFQSLFNSHTHPTPSGQSSAPSQTMGSGELTNTVKGG